MDEYTLAAMLYTALQTALLSCIRYWLYQDNLRVPAKRMYAVSFAVSVGGTLLWVLTGGVRGLSFSLFRVLLAAAMLGVSCGIIREPLAKHIYTYSFIMAYDSALEITASYVQHMLMPGARDWVFALTAALLIACTFIPATRYLKSMIARLSASGNDKLWGWLSAVSFSFVLMNLLFTYRSAPTPSPRELLSRYLMLFGIVGMYIATARVLETMHETAEVKAALGLTKKRVELQERYYARLVAQMDEVRRMRHDMRHHKAVIAALMREGDMAALAAYVDAASAAGEETVPVSGNLACDSVLLYYLDMAKALSVRVEVNVAIGRETPASDPDLCVILGNLLENAVDAQRDIPQEKRMIRVTGGANATELTLAIDNAFSGKLTRAEDGSLLSTKPGEGHGLGLASVQTVVEKYGGVLQLETEGALFLAGVAIGI